VRYDHTIDVGLGALTGRPLALTGARVPAFSAALCSRWTYALIGQLDVSNLAQKRREGIAYSGFLGDRHRMFSKWAVVDEDAGVRGACSKSFSRVQLAQD
jgi:hypothetical protein